MEKWLRIMLHRKTWDKKTSKSSKLQIHKIYKHVVKEIIKVKAVNTVKVFRIKAGHCHGLLNKF